MEILKDITQLSKGCSVTFIKNDEVQNYEYLMIHPHCETYFLFSKNYAKISRIAKNELFMSFSPQQR